MLLREGGCSFLIRCGRVPWSFGAEGCRPTFRMFGFACRGAILNGKRTGKKWAYIAAGVDGRRWMEESDVGVLINECARVLG